MGSLNKKKEREVSSLVFVKYFLYVLPLVLFFSYYPLIHFGADETMNFEISLPLIWLVLFDLLVFFLMVKQKILFKDCKKSWVWLLFPVFLTISVFWSLNKVRGILVVGILWLICFAIYGIYGFRDYFDSEFRKTFLKWFFGATILVCVWCVLQCALDLLGVSREYSLMCAGCTYKSFGFPHPNGFAIEPQFMGNLLLAPALMAMWLLCKKNQERKILYGAILFWVAMTLFLTFSRGAIYAFIVAMIFMLGFLVVKEGIWKKVGVAILITIGAFLFSLNAQGIMAAVSPTNDTYISGVTKALNHLSLGIIDIRGTDTEEIKAPELKSEVVENPVENFKEGNDKKSDFDGYVPESTDTRIRLTNAAIKIWSGDFRTMMFGVGLGGAGRALYNNGLSPAPKEIVQNQYASLLLETGIVGVCLLIATLILVVRVVILRPNSGMVLSLLLAYGVSLVFFAGLPNALHVYLLLPIFLFVF